MEEPQAPAEGQPFPWIGMLHVQTPTGHPQLSLHPKGIPATTASQFTAGRGRWGSREGICSSAKQQGSLIVK